MAGIRPDDPLMAFQNYLAKKDVPPLMFASIVRLNLPLNHSQKLKIIWKKRMELECKTKMLQQL